MGFFSWKTTDTNRSIPNKYQENRPTFEVWMIDNKKQCWFEKCYGGYGVFGGKDYHELLAEMNGFTWEKLPDGYAELRNVGIDLQYKSLELFGISADEVLYPNLVEDIGVVWKDVKGVDCIDQGYFY